MVFYPSKRKAANTDMNHPCPFLLHGPLSTRVLPYLCLPFLGTSLRCSHPFRVLYLQCACHITHPLLHRSSLQRVLPSVCPPFTIFPSPPFLCVHFLLHCLFFTHPRFTVLHRYPAHLSFLTGVPPFNPWVVPISYVISSLDPLSLWIRLLLASNIPSPFSLPVVQASTLLMMVLANVIGISCLRRSGPSRDAIAAATLSNKHLEPLFLHPAQQPGLDSSELMEELFQ